MTVTLCLSCSLGLFNRRPRGSLCSMLAFFTASYQQLLWTPNSIGVSEGPLSRVWLSLPHLTPTVWNSTGNCSGSSNSTELYNCSTPTRSLKSNVQSSSSGNNCLAVQRSLSSGASFCSVPWEFFLLVPFLQTISAHAISSHNCH